MKNSRIDMEDKFRYRSENIEKALEYVSAEITRLSSLSQGTDDLKYELKDLRQIRRSMEDHLAGLDL